MPERTLKKISEELIELAASGHTAPPFSARFRKLDAEMGYRAMRRLQCASPCARYFFTICGDTLRRSPISW